MWWWVEKRVAAADLSPEMNEPVLTEAGPEMHQECKTLRAMDFKSISAKFDDDQRRETLVVVGWWMRI